jgi:hypothetical protein
MACASDVGGQMRAAGWYAAIRRGAADPPVFCNKPRASPGEKTLVQGLIRRCRHAGLVFAARQRYARYC